MSSEGANNLSRKVGDREFSVGMYLFPTPPGYHLRVGSKRPGNQPHWRQPKRPAEPPQSTHCGHSDRDTTALGGWEAGRRPTIAASCASRVETTIISERWLMAPKPEAGAAGPLTIHPNHLEPSPQSYRQPFIHGFADPTGQPPTAASPRSAACPFLFHSRRCALPIVTRPTAGTPPDDAGR